MIRAETSADSSCVIWDLKNVRHTVREVTIKVDHDQNKTFMYSMEVQKHLDVVKILYLFYSNSFFFYFNLLDNVWFLVGPSNCVHVFTSVVDSVLSYVKKKKKTENTTNQT